MIAKEITMKYFLVSNEIVQVICVYLGKDHIQKPAALFASTIDDDRIIRRYNDTGKVTQMPGKAVIRLFI